MSILQQFFDIYYKTTKIPFELLLPFANVEAEFAKNQEEIGRFLEFCVHTIPATNLEWEDRKSAVQCLTCVVQYLEQTFKDTLAKDALPEVISECIPCVSDQISQDGYGEFSRHFLQYYCIERPIGNGIATNILYKVSCLFNEASHHTQGLADSASIDPKALSMYTKLCQVCIEAISAIVSLVKNTEASYDFLILQAKSANASVFSQVNEGVLKMVADIYQPKQEEIYAQLKQSKELVSIRASILNALGLWTEYITLNYKTEITRAPGIEGKIVETEIWRKESLRLCECFHHLCMLEKDPYLAQDCWKFLIGFLKKNFDFLKEYDVSSVIHLLIVRVDRNYVNAQKHKSEKQSATNLKCTVFYLHLLNQMMLLCGHIVLHATTASQQRDSFLRSIIELTYGISSQVPPNRPPGPLTQDHPELMDAIIKQIQILIRVTYNTSGLSSSEHIEVITAFFELSIELEPDDLAFMRINTLTMMIEDISNNGFDAGVSFLFPEDELIHTFTNILATNLPECKAQSVNPYHIWQQIPFMDLALDRLVDHSRSWHKLRLSSESRKLLTQQLWANVLASSERLSFICTQLLLQIVSPSSELRAHTCRLCVKLLERFTGSLEGTVSMRLKEILRQLCVQRDTADDLATNVLRMLAEENDEIFQVGAYLPYDLFAADKQENPVASAIISHLSPAIQYICDAFHSTEPLETNKEDLLKISNILMHIHAQILSRVGKKPYGRYFMAQTLRFSELILEEAVVSDIRDLSAYHTQFYAVECLTFLTSDTTNEQELSNILKSIYRFVQGQKHDSRPRNDCLLYALSRWIIAYLVTSGQSGFPPKPKDDSMIMSLVSTISLGLIRSSESILEVHGYLIMVALFRAHHTQITNIIKTSLDVEEKEQIKSYLAQAPSEWDDFIMVESELLEDTPSVRLKKLLTGKSNLRELIQIAKLKPTNGIESKSQKMVTKWRHTIRSWKSCMRQDDETEAALRELENDIQQYFESFGSEIIEISN